MPLPDVLLANGINVMPIVSRYLNLIDQPKTLIYSNLYEFGIMEERGFTDHHSKTQLRNVSVKVPG